MSKKKLYFYFIIVFVFLSLLNLSIPNVKASPIYEDFTAYTEVDIPADRISRTASRATVTDVDLDEVVYLYDDKGVDHFDGDFEHLLDVRVTGCISGSEYAFWALTNALGAYRQVGDELYIGFYGTASFYFFINEYYDGTKYSSGLSSAIIVDTTYYLKIKRNESVGTYGTIYLGIYSTAALRNAGDATDGDADNLSITLHAKLDFRYIMAVQSHDASVGGKAINGYVENLDLQEEGVYITFYNNTGGIMRRDNVTIANGTETEYFNNTVVSFELVAIVQGNMTYGFDNFTYNGNYNYSNPYDFSLTITGNMTIWCYFGTCDATTPYIVARFTWNITNPNANVTILFNASDSESSETITNYSWDWGDGNSGSGVTDTHSYTSNGTYSTNLTITSGAGTDWFIEEITIGGGGDGYNWFGVTLIIGLFACCLFVYVLTTKN